MSKIEAKSKILKWLPLAEKWSGQGIISVPVPLILAIIQMESAGDPNAKRPEPDSLKDKQQRRKDQKINMVAEATGLTPLEVMTSYGLMQLLVTTAWGYLSSRHKGPGVIKVLYDPDQNIRYGVSHLATKLKMWNGDVRLAARDYNGEGVMAEAYGRNAQLLCNQFAAMIKEV